MTAKRGAFTLILIFACISLGYGQILSEELKLSTSDCQLVSDGAGGYHLFIRKKPLIESVLISTEIRREGKSIYLAWKSTPRNDEERYSWYLADFTIGAHQLFGQAMDVYIPPLFLHDEQVAGFWNEVPAGEQVYINIRTFNTASSDPSGVFQNNLFILGENRLIEVPAFPDVPSVPAAPSFPSALSMPEGSSAEADNNSSTRTTAAAQQANSSPAFPMTLSFWGGGVLYHPGPDGSMDDTSKLEQQLDPVGSVTFSMDFSELVTLNLGLERDPLLMNRFITRAAVDWDRFGFETGVYFGFLNSGPAVTSPGLSLILRGKIIPDILSGSFRLDTSLGRKIQRSGDYSLDYYEFNFEGMTPWDITFDLSISNRTLSRKIGRGDIIGDWTRYNLSTAYAFRPIPLTLALDMGYQQLNWIYMPRTYSYDAAYIGLSASYKIQPNMELFLKAEVPVYPLEYASVPGAPVLIQAALGFVWILH
jgi:hypothetical protein